MSKATASKTGGPKYTTDVNEEMLNSLFKELVDGCRDDLTEAQNNVDLYYTEITAAPGAGGGKEMWGTLYNDALKIKGTVRSRQLQLLVSFKERVTTKEKFKFEKDKVKDAEKNEMSPEFMNTFLEDIELNKKLLEQSQEIELKNESYRKKNNKTNISNNINNLDSDLTEFQQPLTNDEEYDTDEFDDSDDDDDNDDE